VIPVGTAVPEVDVYDGSGAAPLPVFYDGPALLLFFRAGCRRCDGLLGLVAGIGRVARGLTVIGVSQETIEDTAELLGGLGVRLPVVIDDRPYRATAAFDLQSLPGVVLVEGDRVVWGSEGCGGADVVDLVSRLGSWTGKSEPALHPDYVDAPPAASKHLPG